MCRRIKVNVFANLSEESLLNAHQLSPQLVNRVAQVCNDLAPLVTAHLRHTRIVVDLVTLGDSRRVPGSLLISDTEAQDFSILLLEQLLFVAEIFLKFFKCGVRRCKHLFGTGVGRFLLSICLVHQGRVRAHSHRCVIV